MLAPEPDLFREVATFFTVVPAEDEISRIDRTVPVVFLVAKAADLGMPLARQGQALCRLEFLDRVTTVVIEPLFEFPLDPRQQRMSVAEVDLPQQRVGMQGGDGR